MSAETAPAVELAHLVNVLEANLQQLIPSGGIAYLSPITLRIPAFLSLDSRESKGSTFVRQPTPVTILELPRRAQFWGGWAKSPCSTVASIVDATPELKRIVTTLRKITALRLPIVPLVDLFTAHRDDFLSRPWLLAGRARILPPDGGGFTFYPTVPILVDALPYPAAEMACLNKVAGQIMTELHAWRPPNKLDDLFETLASPVQLPESPPKHGEMVLAKVGIHELPVNGAEFKLLRTLLDANGKRLKKHEIGSSGPKIIRGLRRKHPIWEELLPGGHGRTAGSGYYFRDLPHPDLET